MASTRVKATVGNGKTLEQFSRLITERIKYLGESSRDAVAACAIDALRSIRAATSKATKASVTKGVAVEQDASLFPSMKSVGAAKRFCVRHAGSRKEYVGKEKVANASNGAKLSTCSIFRFSDSRGEKETKYLIVAPTERIATARAKEIRRRRAMRYSGLARTALTVLMKKTATVNERVDADAAVAGKAELNTAKRERRSGDVYAVSLSDNLDYAQPAVKGGQAGIDAAMRKALNKVTSVINQKCKNVLGFERLDPPFPEVRQRK